MSDCVLFEEVVSQSGKVIGVATLNSEKSLNALSLAMVERLLPKLNEWQTREDIAVVVLQGAGEKAFCAGGDVVQLYDSAVTAGKGVYSEKVEEFFTQEYRLDYIIHTYEKPILVWGHGIVMGGGLGLFAGASHRVVTEKSRIAMPEITIGLYPDVGGTYFLNKMPDGCGLFLGLTGASINATDAKYIRLADFAICHNQKSTVIDKLAEVKWGDTQVLNHQKLSDVLVSFEQKAKDEMPASNLAHHNNFMKELNNFEHATGAVAAILSHKSDDKWFTKAQSSLSHGSSLSAQIVFKQLQMGKSLSLEQVFRLELSLSCHCAAIGEFAEGVRALLIEKDQNPNWMFETVHDVDEILLQRMFTSIWQDDSHPLANLTAASNEMN